MIKKGTQMRALILLTISTLRFQTALCLFTEVADRQSRLPRGR